MSMKLLVKMEKVSDKITLDGKNLHPICVSYSEKMEIILTGDGKIS